MGDKLEKLTNMVLNVIVVDNIVAFGSVKYIEIIRLMDNIKSIEEIINNDNKYIKKALKYIRENKKLSDKLKENDININTKQSLFCNILLIWWELVLHAPLKLIW